MDSDYAAAGSFAPGGFCWVYNDRSMRVGLVTLQGLVFNVAGAHVGTVVVDGRVMTPDGTIVGWASPSGHLADRTGAMLTQVRPDGGVDSRRGQYIGYMSYEVPLQLRAAAALLLLPVHR